MTIEMKTTTLEKDPALVNQYIHVRHKNSKGHLPDEPIKGDAEARFLLAVGDDGIVKVGLRLNDVRERDDEPGTKDPKPKGWLPMDKAPGARLEAIFPGSPDIAQKMREKQDGYKVFYVDGTVNNLTFLEKTIHGGDLQTRLFTELLSFAEKNQYAMGCCLPPTDHARIYGRFFGNKGIPTVNLGPQPYTSHEEKEKGNVDALDKGHDRALVLFLHDPQLLEHVRKPPPEVQQVRVRDQRPR